MAYDFHYTPTGTGVISGKEVLEQTEDAINDLGNTAISGVQEALDKAEQALTNSQNAVDDAQSALNTAGNADENATTALNTVNNLSGTVTSLGNRVTTAEGNITNLQGRMTTAESGISGLNTRMGTAEGNITTLQSNVSTAQATANSAQQTATTARQQSYVFRYSGTAVVPNSTIAYSTIDNTDNIKSGDKILDVDGKLFEITAVDTANQTVTVGSALIDLALDANVVHTSGNETVGGAKTFSEDIVISNSDTSQTSKRLVIASSKVNLGDSNSDSWGISFNAGSSYAALINSEKSINSMQGLNFTVRTKDSNNNLISTSYRLRVYTDGTAYLIPSDTDSISLGSNSNKWKDVNTNLVNGLTPSSLCMPASSGLVDISGYITDLSGGNNTYTPLANGFVYVDLQNASNLTLATGGISKRHYLSSGTYLRISDYIHVRSGEQVVIMCSGTLKAAAFIPCQGNI